MAKKSTSPPPAYFLSLSLENVRSFGEKQTISFADKGGRPAQWTIILGDNGVGKTTVLKALAAVGIAPGKGLYPDGKFRDANFDYDWQTKWWPVRHNSNHTTTIINYRAHIGAFSMFNAPSYLSERAIEIPGNHEKSTKGFHLDVESIPKKLWGLSCYGYGAGRTVGNSTIGETPANTDSCASLFDDRADLLDPQEWFLNIDYGSKLAGPRNKSLAEARDRVERMLIDVLPGVTKLRIANAGTPQKPQISLQFLLYDTWVKLRDMSLGYQTLVVWLTDLASKLYIRYPESDNPLAEPAIVLVDEIDLHLHPSWQRELLKKLSDVFPNTQFIATAHSPLVVQAAGDAGANVVLLRREGDQTVVVKDLEDVRNWRLDQILTSELFGLETARSLAAERKLLRRAELLTKTKPTAAERKELAALTQDLDAEPLGETPSEREVNAVLQELRQRLLKKDSSTPAA